MKTKPIILPILVPLPTPSSHHTAPQEDFETPNVPFPTYETCANSHSIIPGTFIAKSADKYEILTSPLAGSTCQPIGTFLGRQPVKKNAKYASSPFPKLIKRLALFELMAVGVPVARNKDLCQYRNLSTVSYAPEWSAP
ncbi:hypothetical protein NPIL_282391 [Nephila pilipes]|uniref:Uncharacterized protein n=1 Tax=Nephila pilipes TaxID=299642 RepID=A0A8X6T8I8_NEPPI|nr:hypothetical protein NPIL_282391 [Nephila pilipes]